MRSFIRLSVSFLLLTAFITNAVPCGPGWVTPIFDYTKSPEYPYRDYAAGKLGVIKPEFHRSVLLAAFRYINGGSFSPEEQRSMVEYWKADIDRDYHQTDDMAPVIKAWVTKRQEIVGKDEKTPEIYVERSYGGYDFFPNCTQNAFETATETLADRAAAHGPSDPNVIGWIKGQDQVFSNCASGKVTPEDPEVGAADWLKKDRAYQKAAAEFYSLDYASAKKHFAEIAQDSESPWQETADYLVARTLIRQASLTRSIEKALPMYEEAETHLERFVSRTGKFSNSAERMMGLIKYRVHPKERVTELGQKLTFQTGNDNFKQDIIDYNWLLDKFEGLALAAEEKRKQLEEAKKNGEAGADVVMQLTIEAALAKLRVSANVGVNNGEVTLSGNVPRESVADIMAAASQVRPKKIVNQLNIEDPVDPMGGKLTMTLYSTDYTKSWRITIDTDASDDEALAVAAKAVGEPLSDDLKTRFLDQRKTAYAGRFTENSNAGYEREYYGEDRLTPSLMPDFLRRDALTEWLFTFQMKGDEAYQYSLSQYRQTGSELWLMTALTKATGTSPDVARLIEAAGQANRTSTAYLTIAYNVARLYIEQRKAADARKLIDEILSIGDDLAISSRNQFMALRLKLADSLEDFLVYSLRRPFAWDFSGSTGSIDELIAEQKTYYDPEYNKEGREAFDREVDGRFKTERLWQDRLMLDSETIDMMNRDFPQALLMEIEKSPVLPDYLRPKFAIALWTRAFLLNDMVMLDKLSHEIITYQPEFEDGLKTILAARTPTAKQTAALYFILKNPLFSPYIEDGMGKADNEFEQWDANDWWCSEYMDEGDGESVEGTPLAQRERPKFLSAVQKATAAAERKRIIAFGNAPKYLADRVFDWAKRSPADRRVPEALFIVHQANGWTKYGCGNDEDLQTRIAALLKKNYPQSEWTAKLSEEKEDQ